MREEKTNTLFTNDKTSRKTKNNCSFGETKGYII